MIVLKIKKGTDLEKEVQEKYNEIQINICNLCIKTNRKDKRNIIKELKKEKK